MNKKFSVIFKEKASEARKKGETYRTLAKKLKRDDIVIVNISGRGDKDMPILDAIYE